MSAFGMPTSATDSGPSWVSHNKYVDSADMSSLADITDAPASGKQIYVTDIFLSAPADCVFTISEEDGSALFEFDIAAKVPVQITPRSPFVLAANKKLQGQTSAAAAIKARVHWYEE